MSYCVNCGVKLDPSLKYCPLCNTPVINPHDLSKMQPVSPFPKEKGQVEVVRRKDLAILLSVSLTAAGLCSLLLNLLVFRQHLWSLYVIGACVLIWVMSIPAVIYTKLPIYLSLLFDGLAVMLYQFLIGFNTTDHSWFFGLSLPITALCTLATILFAFCLRKISSAFLMKALYFFAEAALLCAGIELLIRRYLLLPLRLTWSAVVCSVCGVIVISLITILSRARLRNAGAGRLAGAAGAGEQIRMADAPGRNLVLQGRDDGRLANHVRKALGTPFSIQGTVHRLTSCKATKNSGQSTRLRCFAYRCRLDRGTGQAPLNAARFPA